MKLNFSLKNKELNLEADVKGVVEKNLDYKSAQPEKKTRHQIKQEEKRKNEVQKHKQQMQYLFILLGVVGVCIIIAVIFSILGM